MPTRISAVFVTTASLLALLDVAHAQEQPEQNEVAPERAEDTPPDPAPAVRAPRAQDPESPAPVRTLSAPPPAEESSPPPPHALVPEGWLIEISTAGFASSALTGGLFFGKQWARAAVGVGIDYSRRSFSDEVSDISASNGAILFGVRSQLATAADGRLEALLAGEAGYAWTSSSFNSSLSFVDDSTSEASGFTLAAGPTLRFWVTRGLAIGYQTRLKYTQQSGDGSALSRGGDDPIEDAEDVTATDLRFEGRFSLFGVF